MASSPNAFCGLTIRAAQGIEVVVRWGPQQPRRAVAERMDQRRRNCIG